MCFGQISVPLDFFHVALSLGLDFFKFFETKYTPNRCRNRNDDTKDRKDYGNDSQPPVDGGLPVIQNLSLAFIEAALEFVEAALEFDFDCVRYSRRGSWFAGLGCVSVCRLLVGRRFRPQVRFQLLMTDSLYVRTIP